MIKKIGVDEKSKTPAYLNTETGLVSFGCGIVETITDEEVIAYGIDYLERQRDGLKRIRGEKDPSKPWAKTEIKHLDDNLKYLDAFIELAKLRLK